MLVFASFFWASLSLQLTFAGRRKNWSQPLLSACPCSCNSTKIHINVKKFRGPCLSYCSLYHTFWLVPTLLLLHGMRKQPEPTFHITPCSILVACHQWYISYSASTLWGWRKTRCSYETHL